MKPGYSHIKNPTAGQLADLTRRQVIGELGHIVHERDVVYYRRRHGFNALAHTPNYSDEDIERERLEIEDQIARQEKLDEASLRAVQSDNGLPFAQLVTLVILGGLVVGATISVWYHAW